MYDERGILTPIGQHRNREVYLHSTQWLTHEATSGKAVDPVEMGDRVGSHLRCWLCWSSPLFCRDVASTRCWLTRGFAPRVVGACTAIRDEGQSDSLMICRMGLAIAFEGLL